MRRLLSVLAVIVLGMTSIATATEAHAARRSTVPSVSRLSPQVGPTSGGTAVVITGSGFRNVTGVSFGGVAAAFRVDSTSQLTTTTPAHAAGLVDVRVTTSSGTSAAVSSSRFSFQSPAPSTAKVTVTRDSNTLLICFGPISGCGAIRVTTEGFTSNVTCYVSASSSGKLGGFWTQGPNTSYTTGIMFEGSWVEVTCDGVVGRNTTWPN